MSQIMTPIKIGGVEIKNRVFLPGHTTNFGVNNLPSERNANYLAARAKGGVGLIISEAIRVHPTSAGRSLTLGASDDRCIPSYEKLTKAVHEHGAAIFAQIMHAGRQANGDATHTAAWSASRIPWTRGGQVPHEMSQADIATMVDAFGSAAIRMQRSGFDGLEVHLGHGHLIQQFLSPASNTRSDKYGGSVENRMRFAVEILEKVFAATPDMPVGIRISADEFMPEGLLPDDMVEIVEKLNERFDLSFLHVSHSAYHGSRAVATQIADMSFDHAPFRYHATIFKNAFPKIPLLAVCRLDSVSQAAELIDSCEADMVGLARPHIADPEIVNKYVAGANSQVTSCIACNQECIGRVEKNLPISCAVNPEVGAEKRWLEIRKAKPASKRVLVIGGGPAGMSAALSASKSGHDVTLFEGGAKLGGQVAVASTLKKRERIGLLTQELEIKLRDSEIKVELNKNVSNVEDLFESFDKIILATGVTYIKRNFGLGVPTFTSSEAIAKFCSLRAKAGEEIVLFDEEGTWIAASIAEQLGINGYRVHLVSPTATLFSQITLYSKLALIPRLKELGVQFYLASEVRVEEGKVVIASSMNEQSAQISKPIALIDCAPRLANDELYQQVAIENSSRLLLIGDALSPRSVAEATFEGTAIGAFLDLDLALSALEG